ncbi:amidohydrolase family protein [Sphingomonas suaedae]|uniref:Amidohydrolase family protein n=1 Tax=Sphingomonas suaedae TaxID=2599297 RepID=A0A518RCS0_9SPHN|nr:amidohydrolase family protein [Sphingomonas suaedae]QDX25181.1 amidohydrolase family protein [Sphingomonas suaedae]
MTYANGRIIHDADSHTMETGDWLAPYLDPSLVESLGSLYGDATTGQRILSVIEQARARKNDAAADAEARENIIAGTKGWGGYGAFDTEERVRALDALGFESQLVFPTFGLGLVRRAKDEDTLYKAAHALNCAQAAFCAADPRLIYIAFIPLDNPDRAMDLLDKAIEQGAGAVLLPSNAPAGERSPGHTVHDPFWAKLEAEDIPFTLHIGPGTFMQPKAFHNNGRERAPDLHGGGENLRFGDYPCLGYAPQMFITALVYDGVFDRFPALRGAVVECGAGWVPEFLRQLDGGLRSFGKTDPYLQAMKLKPSDYVRRAMKFTPFPSEDVGRMIRDAGAELFLFSSDYPHPEGTKDPIGRFEATMEGIDEESKDAFYRRNYEALMNIPAAAEAIAAE